MAGSPALHTLRMDLEGNRIKDAGAEALATLPNSRTLHTLELNLRDNCIKDPGACALARLIDSPHLALHTFELDLQTGFVEDAGAKAFTRSLDHPASSLREFRLSLQGNYGIDLTCESAYMAYMHGNGDSGKSQKITENHGNRRKRLGHITETAGVHHGKSRKPPSRSLQLQSN